MAGNYTTDKSLYLINGYDFAIFGAMVETPSPTGLLGLPKRKPSLQYNWADENGLDIDLGDYKVEARNIKINVVMKSDSFTGLQAGLNSFLSQFLKPGLQSLKMAGIPGLFLVYLADEVTPELLTNLNANPMAAKLSLSLQNPEPVTKQFYTIKNAPGSSSLAITTTKPVTIAWGDGSFDYVIGTAEKVHNYQSAGTFCIVVYGGVDGITSLAATDCIDVASELSSSIRIFDFTFDETFN
jgi:hypothetical protein